MERRYRTLKAGMLLPLLAVVMTGCGLRNPSAPTWDIELNLPLVDKNLSLVDLVGSPASAKGDTTLPPTDTVRIWGPARQVEIPQLETDAVSGRIAYEIENALPLFIDTATVYLGCDSALLYQSPLVVIGPLAAGPMVGGDSNACCDPVRSTMTVTLDAAQLSALTAAGARVYAGYSIVTRIAPDTSAVPDSLAYVRAVAVATIVKRIN